MTYINHTYLIQDKEPEPLLIKISGTVEEAVRIYAILKKEFGEFYIFVENDYGEPFFVPRNDKKN